MLSLCWAKNDVFLSGLASMPKRTRRFWVVGAMLGLCGPYVGPMLDHVGLLGAMLGPPCAYVEPMCWAKNSVFIWALALRPK